jgi:hypothetical protein
MSRANKRARTRSRAVAGAHRAVRRDARNNHSLAVRTMAVGGAAVCIGFIAEMNAPDAEALSLLLPMGNGSATQINILEGNVIDPQFNPAGNTSSNTTVGNIMLGGTPVGSSDVTVPIDSGGAAGYGNVTQVNVLSYNIFNPQASLFGNNVGNNTTVSNVSAGNGNGAPPATSGGLIGSAAGAGNTTQIALLSGNILNPQASLFGSNISNNTAATNLSVGNGNGSGIFGTEAFSAINGSGTTNQSALGAGNIANPQFSLLGSNTSLNTALVNQSFFNGNLSPTTVQGDGLGTFLVGLTGSGNSNQLAGGVSNIWNTQGTLGGYNASDNTAGSNNAGWNGVFSPTNVGSTNGGNNTIFGQVGAGNANQAGNGNGNISNDQFRLFTGLTQPHQAPTGNAVQVNGVTTSTEQATGNQPTALSQETPTAGTQPENQPALTNADVLSAGQQGNGTGPGKNGSGVLLFPNGQGGTGGGLSPLGQKVADAVKGASDAVKGALTPNKPATGSASSTGSAEGGS